MVRRWRRENLVSTRTSPDHRVRDMEIILGMPLPNEDDVDLWAHDIGRERPIGDWAPVWVSWLVTDLGFGVRIVPWPPTRYDILMSFTRLLISWQSNSGY